MAISQDYIAELSRRIDISELVGSYVELKRAGRMERGLCPFHNEKTPSFYVYPETASYYCFGCGSGGDAITFVKNIQNLEYVEAVKFLAARAGMPLPDEDDTQSRLRGRMLSINRETARFFFDCLNADLGREGRAYLRGRGLTDATIRRFGLGYAPDEFGLLRDHLKAKGFTEEELILAGVCKRSQRGGVYDAFRGRVMFPIIDLRGNVIAFGGRRMGDEGGPKYLNSSDTPVFKKSRNLFALNVAKKSASKRFLLAEGYMDVIALHQAGFDTAVATLGTALTAEQAKLISDYAGEAVICYDSDEAGQKATERAIGILGGTPLKITVLAMDGAKDPDEYITKFGADKFEALLTGSRNTIEYALTKEKRNHDTTTPDGRAAYLKAALDILASEATPTEQDIYAGRLSEETDVAKSAILTQLEGVVRRRQSRLRRQREERMKSEGVAASINLPYGSGSKALKVAYAEQQLIAALIKDPGRHLAAAKKGVHAGLFVNPDMADAYTHILQMAEAHEPVELATLAPHISEGCLALLSRVLAQNYDNAFTEADVQMYIDRMHSGELSPERAAEIPTEEFEDFLEKMRRKKQPRTPEEGAK